MGQPQRNQEARKQIGGQDSRDMSDTLLVRGCLISIVLPFSRPGKFLEIPFLLSLVSIADDFKQGFALTPMEVHSEDLNSAIKVACILPRS